MTRRIAIIGAGGFAREVLWLIEEINRHAGDESYEFLGYVVGDMDKLTEHDSVDQVLGDASWLDQHHGDVEALALGIGTAALRLKVSRELEQSFDPSFWPPLIHPNVRYDSGSCKIGHGVIICAGVVGTVNLDIHPFAMVNLTCTLGHEAVIGRASVLNPTVNISGGVKLGSGVLVGTGSQVLQYVEVCDHVTVGAGAVVTKSVLEPCTVVGIPAKPLKQ